MEWYGLGPLTSSIFKLEIEKYRRLACTAAAGSVRSVASAGTLTVSTISFSSSAYMSGPKKHDGMSVGYKDGWGVHLRASVRNGALAQAVRQLVPHQFPPSGVGVGGTGSSGIHMPL